MSEKRSGYLPSAMRAAGGCVVMIAIILGTVRLQAGPADAPKTRLAHNVYFSLNDNSEPAREKLAAACRKHLTGHPGTVSFSVGVLAREFDREVNDRDFDVSLHLVFENKAAHDLYQKAERHLKFIEENSSNWKKVRVFDSYVSQ